MQTNKQTSDDRVTNKYRWMDGIGNCAPIQKTESDLAATIEPLYVYVFMGSEALKIYSIFVLGRVIYTK